MRTLLVAALVAGLVGLVQADDKKADPTGTWKWETEFDGQKREQTLKLKLDGRQADRGDDRAEGHGDEDRGRQVQGRGGDVHRHPRAERA